ncbi:hypothetical protein CDL15_Pgr012631 [Punica granatum]|uniref:Uncharacterized protein n=1 Tax=Punica granatum TaxID=22663 RepID=A0A218XYE3_PUNGR|nr:hypothetical protein CDL15_Pgr012631 [Punica granatum]PKI70216.1 hypothetical protein CRG98_009408 [Punica granatum]
MAELRSLALLILLLVLSLSPLMSAHEAHRALGASLDGGLPGHTDHNQLLQIHMPSSFVRGRKLVIHGVQLKRAKSILPRGSTTSTSTPSSSSSAFRTVEMSAFSVMASLLCSSILLRALHLL